jgi:hypothetical protein
MRRPRWIAALATVAVVSLASRAGAGILDDAAPDVDAGKHGTVVYRIGAIYHEAGHAEFTITCTSVAARPVHVVLEVYGDDERRVGTPARMKLAPRASGTFASAPALPASGAVALLDLPTIDHGKARVSAEHGGITCTGLTFLRGDDGDTRELPFTLLKRVAPAQ